MCQRAYDSGHLFARRALWFGRAGQKSSGCGSKVTLLDHTTLQQGNVYVRVCVSACACVRLI